MTLKDMLITVHVEKRDCYTWFMIYIKNDINITITIITSVYHFLMCRNQI